MGKHPRPEGTAGHPTSWTEKLMRQEFPKEKKTAYDAHGVNKCHGIGECDIELIDSGGNRWVETTNVTRERWDSGRSQAREPRG